MYEGKIRSKDSHFNRKKDFGREIPTCTHIPLSRTDSDEYVVTHEIVSLDVMCKFGLISQLIQCKV